MSVRRVIFVFSLGIIVMTCRCHPANVGKQREVDILEYAAEHPRSVIIHYADGTTYKPKYGDMQLEKTENLLSGRYERPWTVPKVIQWYSEAKESETRVALLRLLAASRDERVIPYLGSALNDNNLDVRVSATYAILDYFMDMAVEGGTEQHMVAVQKWYQEWKANHGKQ